MLIRNNPIVSTAFQKDEVKDFLKNLMEELSDPYTLKRFLRDGWESIYEEQILQLKKSYNIISFVKNDKEQVGFTEVERAIDGVRFKIGDEVWDSVSRMIIPIGLMYEDNRGLHIQLVVDETSVTWRDLSQIEHDN